MRYQYRELRWDHVEPLRGLLADPVHRRLPTGAKGVVRFDRHMDARQVGGKCAAVGATLRCSSCRPDRISLVVASLGDGNGLLDIFKRQMQLVRIELLRAAAKLGALQLMEQMLQPVVLRLQVIAFGPRSAALGARLRKHRLQHGDIGRRRIGTFAHARNGIRFARHCAGDLQPDSISHSLTTSPVGRGMSAGSSRAQSKPSTSAAS